MKLNTGLPCVLVCLAAIASAQAPRTKTAPKAGPATEKVEFAKWGQYWEYSLGITETEFKEAGLERLTSLEASKLWITVYNHRPTLSCGVEYGPKETDEYHYVHLHVNGSDSDAEFVGRLRGRLSSIRDVKMAPSEDAADLVVAILAVSSETDNGHRFGLTVATTVYESCVYTVKGGLADGTQKFRKIIDTMVNAGPDEDSVASRIANTLEARDFDETRQNHAQVLKYLQK